jgi:Carboxypeptidase regulatory-like domain
MLRLKKTLSIAAFLLLTAYCSLLTAQSTGGIKGKVRNMRGDSVAGATVTARQNGQDMRSATTGAKGEFLITGLDPGFYNISFDAKGYSLGVKYNVEVKQNKTVDLGERLIMQIDRGTQVIVKGSVFFKDGTSVQYAKVDVEKINADGTTKKIGSFTANIYGEFTFRQPEGPAKFRITVHHKDSTATKELEVETAAIYRLAISLPIERQ